MVAEEHLAVAEAGKAALGLLSARATLITHEASA